MRVKGELTRVQLQKVLNNLADAHTKAFENRMKLKEHCLVVYGEDPADIDNDEFIDACDGGSGRSRGMTVDEFDASMNDCIEQNRN